MFRHLLRSVVRQGSFTFTWPNGRGERFGSGSPHVAIKVHDRAALMRLAVNPDLAFGELYMDGRLTVEQGDIADVLALLMANLNANSGSLAYRMGRALRRFTRRVAQYNPAPRAMKNVAHHYDLSAKLYDLFLDKDRQYSCAYFTAPGETLEDAQIGKKRHIAAKLFLDRPGLKVLDIGCGWGGLALDLARDAKADVLGITLSTEQIAVARQRTLRAQVADRCRFGLTDYRALTGTFDRIVSVGMFEHVGVDFYQAYFDKVRDLLADGGVALIHTIGRSDGPGATPPWIAKYIFPGGYVPALSEVLPAIEKSGLIVTDIEILRLHYAETLKEWRKRFAANRGEIASLYDERFCRMWEFYLAGAEMAFRCDGQAVFQIQLTKRLDALPITRDYMLEQERSMRFAGTEEMPRADRAA
ncbi:MAG: class I SAM-dependent methyltransferase [Proteobacteria bacterium]|nr:class I SAM-dependent methyltransferase [Pseudomonadota bacterium]